MYILNPYARIRQLEEEMKKTDKWRGENRSLRLRVDKYQGDIKRMAGTIDILQAKIKAMDNEEVLRGQVGGNYYDVPAAMMIKEMEGAKDG